MPGRKTTSGGQTYELKLLAMQIVAQLPKDRVRALNTLDYTRWLIEQLFPTPETGSPRTDPVVGLQVVR